MSQKNKKKSIVVIGGGPGGYVAAIKAAQLGAAVTLIEKEKLGGTCLNVGCIPTKVLLHSAEVYSGAMHAADYGIDVSVKGFDWAKIQKKKESVSAQLVNGVTGLMKANKIKVIGGTARFVSKNSLEVKKTDGSRETVKGDKIIIASGSIPAIPPIPGVKDNPNCIDSTGALGLKDVPKTMTIIGGGVIGIEFAMLYSQFGTRVTVLEALPQLLPFMDNELTGILAKKLNSMGVEIRTSARVSKVEQSSKGEKVSYEIAGKTESAMADKVLVAVGRRANTESLDLEKASVQSEKGRISVNDRMETNVPGIYAIGDCLGQVMLAHVASAQAEIAVQNAMGDVSLYDGKTNPSCVYTNPEFAGVGYTEEKAKEEGLDYSVGKFPLSHNGKALIENGGEGLVKVIIGNEYKEILGVHIIGPRATDLIAESALAIGTESTIDELIDTIHAHPTVSEAVREAVLASDKRAIHGVNR